MNDKHTGGGPNVGLLLLIPAAAIVARAAMRHHRMAWETPGEPGDLPPFRRHGGHRFAGQGFGDGTTDGFRLPPRIEWMLETWHTRAHKADRPNGAAEAEEATTTETPTA